MDIKSVINSFKKYKELSITQLTQLTGESKDDLSYAINELVGKRVISPVDSDKSCTSGCKSCSVASFCGDREISYRWNR